MIRIFEFFHTSGFVYGANSVLMAFHFVMN